MEQATRLGGDVPLRTKDPELTTHHALVAYKEQDHPAQRCTWLKGAGIVAPVLLKSPKRIEAWCFVVGLVLHLLTLIAREAARQIAQDGEPVRGLKPNTLKDFRPKTTAILEAFRKVTVTSVIFTDQSSEPVLSPLSPWQRYLWHRRDLDESIDTVESLTRPLVARDSSSFVRLNEQSIKRDPANRARQGEKRDGHRCSQFACTTDLRSWWPPMGNGGIRGFAPQEP